MTTNTESMHREGMKVLLADAPSCAKCGSTMKDVVTIAPIAGEPGLVAFECTACGHVTSVIVAPQSTG